MRTKKYRRKTKRFMSQKKIRETWALLHGPIPVDENGVTFDIHHKDGNPNNNDPENWEALSVVDHYHRHREQKDWYATLLISYRLQLSGEEKEFISKKVSEVNKARIITPEWRNNISKALRGRKWTPEQRAKIPLANKGKKRSAEICAAISLRQIGTKASEETRRKLSASHKGQKISEETKKKMSIAHKEARASGKIHSTKGIPRWPNGRNFTPEWREKIAASHRGLKKWPNGRVLSAETKNKISETLKRNFDPEDQKRRTAKRLATLAAKKVQLSLEIHQ